MIVSQRSQRALILSGGLVLGLGGSLEAAWAEGPAVPAASTDAVTASAQVLSDADLDRLRKGLLARSATERLAIAGQIVQADRDGFATYAARLARPLPAQYRPEVMKRLIHAIWGQYPNPEYPRGPGKDPPMWLARPEPPPPPPPPGKKRAKLPPPHNPEAVDWLTELARLDVEKDEFLADLPPAEVQDTRAEMLFRVALLRTLASAGQKGVREAIPAIFDFAFVLDGLFRDECGRTIRSMGSYAVPALIRIYNDRTRKNYKMRRYASYQLDRMDRLRPQKAIATAPDDVVRADIIHAYGEALAIDAVEAVLEQVNASSHRVRREARWTWLRYVDGPEPPPPPKRKRKLAGGKEEAEEKEDYLSYRELAVLALGRTFQTLWSRDPDPKKTARQLTDELFAFYDQQREQEFGQLLATAKEAEGRGEIEKAVEMYGFILAHQPDHPRKSEMAAAYRKLGESFAARGEERSDAALVGRALGLLRVAVALDPGLADGDKLRARIHFLDGKQARQQGGDGYRDFELALRHDPTLAEARQALVAAAPRPAHRRAGLWLLAAVGVVLCALVGVLSRRRSRL